MARRRRAKVARDSSEHWLEMAKIVARSADLLPDADNHGDAYNRLSTAQLRELALDAGGNAEMHILAALDSAERDDPVPSD